MGLYQGKLSTSPRLCGYKGLSKYKQKGEGGELGSSGTVLAHAGGLSAEPSICVLDYA